VQAARSSVGEKEPESSPLAPSPRAFPTIQEMRDRVVDEAERKYLHDLLSFTQGNIQEACRISGLSRSRFYLLLKKYRISKSFSPA
jgi:transcriptional regulator of acetoin/glycerol metabolism